MNSGKQTRRILIGIARRHQRPGSGSAPVSLRRRTARMQFPDLGPVLAPLPWAAVGAAAARLYMPERVTDHRDILVRAQDAPEVTTKLAEADFAFRGAWSIGGSSWVSPSGFPVDVIECREAWCEQALVEAQANRDAQGIPALPLPFLVLMKFQASRVQDVADVARMLGQAAPEQLEAARLVFSRWLPDEREDMESLIALGQLEMQEDSPLT
jgi:hypothetical protein